MVLREMREEADVLRYGTHRVRTHKLFRFSLRKMRRALTLSMRDVRGRLYVHDHYLQVRTHTIHCMHTAIQVDISTLIE